MADTILVVDDDADVRTIARTALLRLGHPVLETGDPHEALRIAKAQSVDLLLTDVIMPLMNGLELADRIQGVNARTKIIVMSGYQTAAILGSGRAFIPKPFSVEGLGIRVRELLDRPSAFARTRPPSATGTTNAS